MPKKNFWSDNNQANVKKLQNLIDINPLITNQQIAQFFFNNYYGN